MSNCKETRLWCLYLSSVIVAFVIGYLAHEYMERMCRYKRTGGYDDEDDWDDRAPARREPRPVELSASYVPPFAGSERFRNGVPSHLRGAMHNETGDEHDDKVIERIKRDNPLGDRVA